MRIGGCGPKCKVALDVQYALHRHIVEHETESGTMLDTPTLMMKMRQFYGSYGYTVVGSGYYKAQKMKERAEEKAETTDEVSSPSDFVIVCCTLHVTHSMYLCSDK